MTSPRLLLAGVLFTLAVPSGAYQLTGGEWETESGPVEYALHPAGSDDINDGSDLDAVRTAFETWACLEGTRLRVRESAMPGVIAVDPEDGVHSVFWDETGDFMLGPGVLGVAQFSNDQDGFRVGSDIVFNGIDSSWSTSDAGGGVDVGSIAIHEIGHMLGMGHSCTDQSENDCVDDSVAVMSPAWSGAIGRDPLQDDVDGYSSLYPQDDDDESTCTGPFRNGEYCTCNDDCAGDLNCVEQIDGTLDNSNSYCSPLFAVGVFCTCNDDCEDDLKCVAQIDGSNQCVRTCDGDEPTLCGPGFNCLLGAKEADDEPAPGVCLAVVPNESAPPSAYCVNDGFSCGARDCTQLGAVGTRICFQGCQEDSDCPDQYECSGIACTVKVNDGFTIGCPNSGGAAIPCASSDDDDDDDDDTEDPGAGCACAAPSSQPLSTAAFALLLGLVLRRRRR